MTYPEPIVLAETTSTNTYLAALCQKEACAELTTVYSSFQSAGRGQRGNSWESEAGKNLLFSFVVYPEFLEAHRQFYLSQVTALALHDVLSSYTEGISIKWPNDIYWKDKKICGTLIENDLTGIHQPFHFGYGRKPEPGTFPQRCSQSGLIMPDYGQPI